MSKAIKTKDYAINVSTTVNIFAEEINLSGATSISLDTPAITIGSAGSDEVTTTGTLTVGGDTTSTGALRVVSTTQSTSTSTGSIVTAGGIGIAKDMYCGGTIYFSSLVQGAYDTSVPDIELELISTMAEGDVKRFAMGNDGDAAGDALFIAYERRATTGESEARIGLQQFNQIILRASDLSYAVEMERQVYARDTTASTSSTTGSVIVAGGVGVAKEIFVGSTTDSTSTSTGSIVTAGGLGVAKSIFGGLFVESLTETSIARGSTLTVTTATLVNTFNVTVTGGAGTATIDLPTGAPTGLALTIRVDDTSTSTLDVTSNSSTLNTQAVGEVLVYHKLAAGWVL